MAASRYRLLSRIGALPADHWDALFDPAYPFTRHAWLNALERHGCVAEAQGWEPCHLLALDAAGTVTGAAPLYRKHHSYGEFVFDFSWADASHRLGRAYYPKLLCAVPFVPSSGPRLGARDDAARLHLAEQLKTQIGAETASSAHVLFASETDTQACRSAGWLERHDLQFHWQRQSCGDMADFLARLNSEKRKKLLRERRRVAEAGIGFDVRRGRDLKARDWDHVHALYANTYLERGQLPYFSRDFLAEVGTHPDLDLRLIVAVHDGRDVAVAIVLVGGDTLYGRHWGAAEHYHSLHFEACYYQGIELCLREGLQRFDAGTQGAHKLGRGFDPVLTRSYHVLDDPRLSAAVEDYLQRERHAVTARWREFMHHRPYRQDSTAPVELRV